MVRHGINLIPGLELMDNSKFKFGLGTAYLKKNWIGIDKFGIGIKLKIKSTN